MDTETFLRFMDAEVTKMKKLEFDSNPIKTIGEVILLLKLQPQDNIIKIDYNPEQSPYELTTYRGYYEDLAIDFSSAEPEKTVGELLTQFEYILNKPLEGYKGGTFKMHTKTLVWVASWGSCGRMLIDIKSKNGETILVTQRNED